MVNRVTSVSGTNQGGAMFKSGKISHTHYNSDPENRHVDPDIATAGQEIDYGMWSTSGSGVNINVTGSVLFDSSVEGGAINGLHIVNRGPNSVSFEVNDTVMDGSGSYTLLAGEEVDMSMVPEIRKLIAYTAITGVDTVMSARGVFIYNPHTI